MLQTIITIVALSLMAALFSIENNRLTPQLVSSGLVSAFKSSFSKSATSWKSHISYMKMKFGALVVDGRGKIGGHVASKNRAGAYLRTKVTPVNPSTTAQSLVRNRLAGISSGWRGLTAAQRLAWNAAVSDFAKTDIFGDIRNPTGFNLYQRLNNNLLTCGEAAITSPPAALAVDSFLTLSLTAEDSTVAQSLSLVFTPAVSADHLVKVYATPPMSAGISFVKSEYRLIEILANSASSPADILASYQAVHGSTGEAGQKIFVQVVQVEETSGIAGIALEASAIVTVSA